MDKKYVLLGATAVLAATAVVGGTLAALNTTTENSAGAAVAGISLKEVSVSLGDTVVSSDDISVAPGAEWENPYSGVTNNSQAGYDLYAKVVIDHYWTDADGNYLDLADSDIAGIYLGDSELYEETDEASCYSIGDWFITYSDAEQTVMYYKKPLAPGETSSAFFSNIRFSENMDNNYTDTAYHVEVTVTGVQANNAENAIAAELGVFAEFDGDGNITSIVGVR